MLQGPQEGGVLGHHHLGHALHERVEAHAARNGQRVAEGQRHLAPRARNRGGRRLWRCKLAVNGGRGQGTEHSCNIKAGGNAVSEWRGGHRLAVPGVHYFGPARGTPAACLPGSSSTANNVGQLDRSSDTRRKCPMSGQPDESGSLTVQNLISDRGFCRHVPGGCDLCPVQVRMQPGPKACRTSRQPALPFPATVQTCQAPSVPVTVFALRAAKQHQRN